MPLRGHSDDALPNASRELAADISAASSELNDRRTAIATARETLLARLHSLEEEVMDLRNSKAAAVGDSGSLLKEAAALKYRAQNLENRRLAALDALGEFGHALEARLDVIQLARHKEKLVALEEAVAADRARTNQLSSLTPALALVEAVTRKDLSLEPVAGRALDRKGLWHAGVFLRAGPESFFISHDNQLCGPVEPDSSGSEALTDDSQSQLFRPALQTLTSGATAVLPLDISGGALRMIRSARLNLVDKLRQGGIVMIPLLAIGAAALLTALLRFFALLRITRQNDRQVQQVLDALTEKDFAAARSKASESRQPWRDVLEDTVQCHENDPGHLEEVLQDRMAIKQLELNRGLSLLSICAAAAPLLGLLGTVTGMIHTFQLITLFGTGDARTLSGGISEALLTTQVGLTIAVPTLLAQVYLARRAKGILIKLESLAIRIIRHSRNERGLA